MPPAGRTDYRDLALEDLAADVVRLEADVAAYRVVLCCALEKLAIYRFNLDFFERQRDRLAAEADA